VRLTAKRNRPGRRRVISPRVVWKIRKRYLKSHCQWGPAVLMHWCEREGLGHYSPTTIAKVIVDLIPSKPKRLCKKGYEITEPMVMWSQDATGFRQDDGKSEMMVIMDECSRFKLEWTLRKGSINEDHVLGNLRRAFEKYGAPLILKHDNIAYQNTIEVKELCDEFGVVLATSPYGYPGYNGKTERSMRDIKSYESALRRDGIEETLKERIKMTFNDLNETRPRPVLKGRTAKEVFESRNIPLPNHQRFKMDVQTKQIELEEKSKTELQKKTARRKVVEQVLLDYKLLIWKGDMSTNLTAKSGT